MCSVSYLYIVCYGVGLCFIKEFKKNIEWIDNC